MYNSNFLQRKFGIILLVAAISDLLRYLHYSILYRKLYSTVDLNVNLANLVPVIVLAIISLILIIYKRKLKLKAVSCSLIVFGILEMIICLVVDSYSKSSTIMIISLAEILIYIVTGALLFVSEKYIKICSLLLTVLAFAGCLLSSFFGFYSYRLFGLFDYFTPFYLKAGGAMVLISLSFFLHTLENDGKKADTTHTVTINTDIIDFKQMLEFIEYQYKSGEIAEEEYKTKRTEILKKL